MEFTIPITEQPRERLCIRQTRIQGGAAFYLLTLIMMFVGICFCLMLFSKQRVYFTYDTIDDAIVSALTSSCLYNTDEYGLSGQTIIYRTISPVRIPDLYQEYLGQSYEKVSYNPLEDQAIKEPSGDAKLENCYARFLSALKRNMRLQADMTSNSSGIIGPVKLESFSVINKYELFETDGEVLQYQFVAYQRDRNGSWQAYEYPPNTNPQIYNGFDKTTQELTDTSVVAQIGMRLRTFEGLGEYTVGLTEEDLSVDVTYQRIVAIKHQ